jgi:sigma-B regulation protein RsbU (phosphoserine phosphatase)
MADRSLNWVRAGHEPAVLFDPSTDRFEELSGEGIALGIDGSWKYTAKQRTDLTEGQIILLSTDGIWEARNPQDEMFGKPALYRLIRENSAAEAQEILDAILAELNQFQQNVELSDDITLVIIKIKAGEMA